LPPSQIQFISLYRATKKLTFPKQQPRFSSGLDWLDRSLGGGLMPGSLTMVIGATGVGKTQLGMHFAAGQSQKGVQAAVIDLSSRGDSQNHSGYTSQLFGKSLVSIDLNRESLDDPLNRGKPADVLPFLGYSGHRVLRSQLDVDQWHTWQSELNRRLPLLYRFVYGHLVHGTRLFVVDGIEPQDSPEDSLQLDLLESVYHRMLRKEHDWLAREVFRQQYRQLEQQVLANAYDHQCSSAIVLVTTKQSMLEQLMTQPLADGDLAAGANTIILMGRTLANGRMSRGIYIAKHRGSYADDRIQNFEITDRGLSLAG
jgi:KaiC/GvpD/RAD55 family RecA-like ATPase